MMKYSYKVKRRKRSIEELNYYQELYGDARDEFGDLIFDLNDIDMIYDEPIVEMVCNKCLYEEEVSHHILVELNYGNKSLHALACPMCSHTRKKGTLYPKDITDINGNPITYKDVLNSK